MSLGGKPESRCNRPHKVYLLQETPTTTTHRDSRNGHINSMLKQKTTTTKKYSCQDSKWPRAMPLVLISNCCPMLLRVQRRNDFRFVVHYSGDSCLGPGTLYRSYSAISRLPREKEPVHQCRCKNVRHIHSI